MSMLCRELNRGKCKTYLVACERTRKAVLIDPVRDRLERYLAMLAYLHLALDAVVDTHTHADHRTATFDLRDLTDARVVMHSRAPAPHVDVHVEDGQTISVGNLALRVLYTPGHTPDGISLYAEDRVFTGDTLLIRGTGRTDFAGGDAGEQYDAIMSRLFTLPDETIVLPAHDYRGNTQSTIGDEKRGNPRLAGKSREEYVHLMENLGLPLPDKIQEALQANQTAIEDDLVKFPTLPELGRVRQLDAGEVLAQLDGETPPLLLDVREPDEYVSELGHIPGAKLMPLRVLTARVSELEGHKERPIIAVCRSGVRSATAAAILTGLGFESVSNLKGGMLEWRERAFGVER
jgi:glyoxylase-like metal-dependent hydrolase (beta-lactamase superfamily II)/rhodanese-related sulfurtransferase